MPSSLLATTLSCHWTGTVDACCSPKYGLVVLTLQWSPGYGPSDEFTIHGKLENTINPILFIFAPFRFMAGYLVLSKKKKEKQSFIITPSDAFFFIVLVLMLLPMAVIPVEHPATLLTLFKA